MNIPQKGDVVFFEKWGGVIGIVTNYDEKGQCLELEWPPDSRWGINRTQPFSPIHLEDIRILSKPSEVLEVTGKLIEKRDKEIARRADMGLRNFFQGAILSFVRDSSGL